MVKYIHNIEIKVFYKPIVKSDVVTENAEPVVSVDLDDEIALKNRLKLFAGLKDSSSIIEERLLGVDDLGNAIGSDLVIFTIRINNRCEEFMRNIFSKISNEERLRIRESIDELANCYLRLDLDKYVKDNQIESVTHGNCIHVRVKLAAYPAKLEPAIKAYDGLIGSIKG